MATEQRRAQRHGINWDGMIVDPVDGRIVGPCKVANVSATGAKLVVKDDKAEVPDEFALMLSQNGGVQRRCELVWRQGCSMGVRFIQNEGAERLVPSHMAEALSRFVGK